LAGAESRQDRQTQEAEQWRAAVEDARRALEDAERLEAERFKVKGETETVAGELITAHDAAAKASAEARRAGELRARMDPIQMSAEDAQAEAIHQDTTKMSIQGQIQAAHDEMKTIDDRLESLRRDDARCFTCHTRLGRDAVKVLVQTLQNQFRSRELDVGGLTTARDAAAASAKMLFAEAKKQQDQARGMGLEASDLEAAARANRARAERIPELEHRQRQLLATLETMPEVSAEALETMRELLPAMESERRGAERDTVRAAQEVGMLQDQLNGARQAITELEVVRHQITDLEADKARFATCAEAFGPAGVPALIIEASLPIIEDEANGILARLAPRYRVSFASQRALKGGGVRETLDVLIADDVADRPLESLSGGERQAVDLAIRIGLARLIAGRAARPIQTLILDEAFTAMDAGRQQATVGLIHALTAEFDQVWFITHDRDMADAFPTKILVSAADGSSSVSVERGPA
jgi:exonuclease SbcC